MLRDCSYGRVICTYVIKKRKEIIVHWLSLASGDQVFLFLPASQSTAYHPQSYVTAIEYARRFLSVTPDPLILLAFIVTNRKHCDAKYKVLYPLLSSWRSSDQAQTSTCPANTCTHTQEAPGLKRGTVLDLKD